MTNLQPIEYSKQRILTTSQLAAAYETNTQLIHRNFSNNKDHYIAGKHYFLLESEDLKKFKADYLQNLPVVDPRAPSLYLWTEKGALLHAKSLNTDKAWAVYEFLVDDYYRMKQQEVDAGNLSAQVQDLTQRVEWLEKRTSRRRPEIKPYKMPELGFHVTVDRLPITDEQEKERVLHYVHHIWIYYQKAATANMIRTSFFKRLTTHTVAQHLRELALEGKIESFRTGHATKFKPVQNLRIVS